MADAPVVHTLLARSTKIGIGASDRRGEGSDRCQWRISRPPFVHDDGQCILLIVLSRQATGTYTVSIGREGMCGDIYLEAKRTAVQDLDVDEVVQELWATGRSGEDTRRVGR